MTVMFIVEENQSTRWNHWPVASYWQSLSQTDVSSKPHNYQECLVWAVSINTNKR